MRPPICVSWCTALGEEGWHLDNVCTLQEAGWYHLASTPVSEGNRKCFGQSMQVAQAPGPFQRRVPRLRMMRCTEVSTCSYFWGTVGLSSPPRRAKHVQPGPQFVLSTCHPTNTCTLEVSPDTATHCTLWLTPQCDPWTSSIIWELVRRPSMQIIGLQEERAG